MADCTRSPERGAAGNARIMGKRETPSLNATPTSALGRRRYDGVMPDRRGFTSKWSRRFLPLLAATLVVGLMVDHALARAGGGGGYHSGGGGGGSHGGGGHGGGGGGELLFDLIWLLFSHPAIGLPVLIVIVLFFVFSAKQGNSSYQSNVIRRGTRLMDAMDKSAAIQGIVAHDPKFDEGALCDRVEQAFLKIQAAWCAQKLDTVRAFISDGVHERFLLQFAEQKAAGYHDRMERIVVDDVKIASVSSEGLFDEVAVRIEANAQDWRESLTDGTVVGGSQASADFVEVWTFLRHRTAVTDPAKSGLMEGNCPNCGAPIELNQSANCAYCKAMLRSGAYDWVLTEITQESEWQVPVRSTLPGVAALRERDPEFDTVSIEDRASVMFWRKATADRTGKIDPLRKIAAPDFIERYSRALHAGPNGKRLFPGECAVGSVEAVGVVVREGRDLALVVVKWSGNQFVTSPDGMARNTGENLWAATLFVLSRAAGVKTDLAKSVSSAHCSNCGAPESGGASNACESCGTVLNDGKHGWVLDDILRQTDPAASQLMAELRNAASTAPEPRPMDPNAARGLLAWMVKVATADGNLDPRERLQIAEFATKWRVPTEQLMAMVDAGLRGDLTVPDPHNEAEAREWLGVIATAAWADGKITREEAELLRAMGGRAGLAEVDINQIVAKARTDLYQKASAALRQSQR